MELVMLTSYDGSEWMPSVQTFQPQTLQISPAMAERTKAHLHVRPRQQYFLNFETYPKPM
jgi:hypothetical protein